MHAVALLQPGRPSSSLGDFVVHEQHGVGKFVEMVQRTGGATREYLVLEYAPPSAAPGRPAVRADRPARPGHPLRRREQPTLSKMGGSDWHKTKSKARRYVKQIAAELIQLYSARMATSGHAFAPDTRGNASSRTRSPTSRPRTS